VGPAAAGFDYINWRCIGLCVVFLLVQYYIIIADRKKPILNPKIGEPVNAEFNRRIKFVFNNKTVLGAITLDMVAVLFGGAVALLPVFLTELVQRFGFLRAAIADAITAYVPLSRNAGMKLLTAIFGLVFVSLFWIIYYILGITSCFILSGVLMVFRSLFAKRYCN
jgi:uncharacterized membrane protein YuzA (DUF378 family)